MKLRRPKALYQSKMPNQNHPKNQLSRTLLLPFQHKRKALLKRKKPKMTLRRPKARLQRKKPKMTLIRSKKYPLKNIINKQALPRVNLNALATYSEAL